MPRKASEPCAGRCGVLLIRYPTSAATMTCNKCRDVHGSANRYKKGCRCDECRAYKAQSNSEFNGRFRAKHGVNPNTDSRRKSGNYGNSYAGWIAYDRRIALYERDDWTCQLCFEPIDREADYNDKLAPTLDHISPRSLGGTDDEDNLRCAHRYCNALRGARVEVTV